MMLIVRKLVRYGFFTCLGFSFIGVMLLPSYDKKPGAPKVAIFFSFSHPLLEECKQSCIDFLQTLEQTPEVIAFNAEDSICKARKIARTLHKQSQISAIITLGPIATKVMSQIEKKKPIVYAGIPDSDISTFSKQQANLHGINANIDVNQCCFAIQTVSSHIDTLIYLRPIEPFPSTLQKEITEKLGAAGIKVSELAVSPANAKNRIHQLIDTKPAAIFIPLSSLSKKQDIEEIIKADIPVITDDASLIDKGACVACSIDYKQSGKQLAQVVYHILYNNEDLKELRGIIADPLPTTVIFNEDVTRQLGIELKAFKKQQHIVLSKTEPEIIPSQTEVLS